MEEFYKKGFPTIKLYEDHFEIKAIDISSFRSFDYSEISKIKYFKEADKGNWFFMLWIQAFYASTDTFRLKIVKQNAGDWEYETQSKNSDAEFEAVLNKIKHRCGIHIK